MGKESQGCLASKLRLKAPKHVKYLTEKKIVWIVSFDPCHKIKKD